jgi:hypothetical protein
VRSRETIALVLGLGAIFIVARVIGIGETPALFDQPRPPATSTSAAESGSGPSVVTALITAGLGFVAFVAGQFVLKLVVDPIQEQTRIVGEVAHALTYYRNVGGGVPVGFPAGSELNRVPEAREAYRDLSARLRMNLRVIRPYRLFSRMQLVLPEEQVRRATSALIGLSNTVQKDPGADDVLRYRYEVRRSLEIES